LEQAFLAIESVDSLALTRFSLMSSLLLVHAISSLSFHVINKHKKSRNLDLSERRLLFAMTPGALPPQAQDHPASIESKRRIWLGVCWRGGKGRRVRLRMTILGFHHIDVVD
jgi:hypothetical protein